MRSSEMSGGVDHQVTTPSKAPPKPPHPRPTMTSLQEPQWICGYLGNLDNKYAPGLLQTSDV